MPTPTVTNFEARSYELDPYGHLNNAVYVNWLEQGRLDYLRARGESYTSIPDRLGVWVVVVRQELDYRAQVEMGDRLALTTQIEHLGNSSFRFDQRLRFEDGRAACDAKVTMVCVDGAGKSAPMPAELRGLLEK
ncbi:MAG: thioesterase family protein [Planctomycetota bacterium]